MLPSQKGLTLTPCTLPSNSYALTGKIYISKADYTTLQNSSKVQTGANYIFVDAKGFILQCEGLAEIETG